MLIFIKTQYTSNTRKLLNNFTFLFNIKKHETWRNNLELTEITKENQINHYTVPVEINYKPFFLKKKQ